MPRTCLELVFILDRSASMTYWEQQTVESFNSVIEQQKKVPGECRITTVLFNSECEIIHDLLPVEAVEPLTIEKFTAQGHTALLDTIGRMIQRVQAIREFTSDADMTWQTMFVIITDGMDNASHIYNQEQIKALVQWQQKHKAWKFIFFGANMDAKAVAQEIGIEPEDAVTFIQNGQGLLLSYEAASQAIREYRETGTVSYCWRRLLEGDCKE